MVILKSLREIEIMRRANVIVAEVHQAISEMICPGITTADIDVRADELVKKKGAIAAFKGYRGYPSSICVSVNEEVVHGIPSSKRVLHEGDIVGIDFGVFLDGYYGDAAITVGVGRISKDAERLLRVTEEALYLAIDRVRVGSRLSDISHAVDSRVKEDGFFPVRDFVGHGIGRSLHEDPQIPNYGPPGKGIRLKAGMVLAIEPMINAGSGDVVVKQDGWTAVTRDGSLSAHFEHSVAITEDGPYILSRI